MNSITIEQAEKLSDKCLLPKANYDSLDLFLTTISDENLGEMIGLCESENDEELEFLSYIMSLIFMYEYGQKECTQVDLSTLFGQFKRQCVAEACARIGLWDISTE